jgi:cytochrome c oxidase subunit 3
LSDSHSPALHHHFEDLGQQYEASNMGMWAFIAQEIMFFGGLFGGYAVYRYQYFDAFVEGSHHLPIEWGALNTVVLIGSSLTVALAVRSAQQGKQMAIFNWIVATMILGAVFLGVKTIEYSHKFHDGLVPGSSFLTYGPYTTAYDAAMAGHLKIFFSFYFVMTGMHALHMIIGIGIMVFLLVKIRRGAFSAEYYNPVENFGLYWHFVDIVWIFLFPLLYLIGGR